jgi:hypothetical protein
MDPGQQGQLSQSNPIKLMQRQARAALDSEQVLLLEQTAKVADFTRQAIDQQLVGGSIHGFHRGHNDRFSVDARLARIEFGQQGGRKRLFATVNYA